MDVDLSKPLQQIAEHALGDCSWFLVGGGPSLRGFDWSSLRGEHVLALNAAALHCEPDAALVVDVRCLREVLGPDARWHAIPDRFWLRPEELSDVEGVTTLARCPRWSDRLEDGVLASTHAGPSGLNLAVLLGARQVFLLGFDYAGEGGRTANFHASYPEDWRHEASAYDRFRSDFELAVDEALARGVTVFNLGPGEICGTLKRPPAEVLRKPA